VRCNSYLKIHPEVANALRNKDPVVALESTIVAHGMPYPQNYEVALEVEDILRNKGVIPATIAIKRGIPRIGLTNDELHSLAKAGSEAAKCSTRDLPYVVQHPSLEWGATTVASTMVLAHGAGITTFVTGGSGGVHRGGESSMDISADLIQLSQTPVVVVSAGIKSILDIRRTLEVLETYGVPTVSFSDEFPAFFSPNSGIMSPRKVDSPIEVSRMYWAARDLQLPCGMLVAVPNPTPADGQEVEEAIHQALSELQGQVEGRDVTPYVLKRVTELTGGKSLESNIALVKNNAQVGAEISLEISKEMKHRCMNESILHHPVEGQQGRPMEWPKSVVSSKKEPTWRTESPPVSSIKDIAEVPTVINKHESPVVVVMGGAVMDIMASPAPGAPLIAGTSNPGKCVESDGGVGRNIAEVLARLCFNSSQILFYTAVGGQDDFGRGLLERLESHGVLTTTTGLPGDTSEDEKDIYTQSNTSNDEQNTKTVTIVNHARTATYLAVLDEHRELFAAIADMDVLEYIPAPSIDVLMHSKFLVLDSNPAMDRLIVAVYRANLTNTTVIWEPTSVPKAGAAVKHANFVGGITLMTPNADELLAMAVSSTMQRKHSDSIEVVPTLNHNNIPLMSQNIQITEKDKPKTIELSLAEGCSRDSESEADAIEMDGIIASMVNAASIVLPQMKRGLLNDKCLHEASHLIVTLGVGGVLHCSYSVNDSSTVLKCVHYPVQQRIKVENCTGAGDTLCGAMIHSLVAGNTLPDAIHFGMRIATKSLLSPDRAVGIDLSP